MMPAVSGASYEVVRLLGEGGIGRVYEAVHHPSRRVVAIKTLRSEHGGPTSQRLLLNEAAAVAQLEHPAIVELLDIGRDDYGAMFLVMELVRGSSLEAWSQVFPGARAVLRAACEMLDALATAHAQGIVHGDLKPANVLLTEDGHVKVTDFGIAHVIDPLRASRVKRGIEGTPYYMAPEQLYDLESIAPPADLYAIGMMLYELLSGREPYPSTASSLTEMFARKLQPIPPLVPRPGIRVPNELIAVVTSLLQSDPRQRPRFAATLRQTFARLLESVRDRRSTPPAERIASATAPTISSSDELPIQSTGPKDLPFSLPCMAATTEVSLHRLRPVPMLGRADQASKLLGLASAAWSGTRGLVVAGRAGEGKTRLLRHGFAEVERTGLLLGAAASFDETVASADIGLRASMRRLVGAPAPSLTDTLATQWQWLQKVPQPGIDFARMHEWLVEDSAAGAIDPNASAAMATMCVVAASRVHPVYLWLDDIAWSRDGAMELMANLLERNEARALVVATLRSGTAEHPTVQSWLLRLAKAGVELLMLPPLAEAERAAVLEAAGPLRAPVARALAAKLNEPPLVLVETVRAWIEGGLLVPGDGGYEPHADVSLDDLAAQATGYVLRGRIATLVDGFGPNKLDAERVLIHAALLGLRFEERALRRCGDPSWVDRVLDRALLSGLLRVDGRGVYRFEHRLYLDVIVDRCAMRPDSQALFCTTADVLAETYGARNPDTGLALAMLYRAGGAHDTAVRIATYTIRGLARANIFDASDRASGLVSSWVEGLPEDHLHRALFEHALGSRLYFALDYPGARKHLHVARKAFQALGASHDLHVVLFEISSTHFYQDHFREAERYLAYAQDPSVEPDSLALAHHRLAELAGLRLDFDAALAHQRACLAADRATTDTSRRVVWLATLAELLVATGATEEAIVYAKALATAVGPTPNRHLGSDMERVLAAVDAGRGYYAAARARLLPRIDELRARESHWQLTSDLALIALCTVALQEDAYAIEVAVRAFVEAYVRVAHDEPYTWWAVRCTQAFLRGQGRERLAGELGDVLDARLATIAMAFDDDEPITEDAEVRSGAARRASSQ
jgi:serine/threonine protein kinase